MLNFYLLLNCPIWPAQFTNVRNRTGQIGQFGPETGGRTEKGTEHFSCQDSGLPQIVFSSEKMLNNVNVLVCRRVK